MAPTQQTPVKTINFKGKPYVEVAERIKQVYNLEVPFEVIESEGRELLGRVVWHAAILVNGKRYVGNAEAKLQNARQGSADDTNPFECAETSAVGRALAWANFGTVDGIASFDEIARSMTPDELQAVLQNTPTPAASTTPAQPAPPAPAAVKPTTSAPVAKPAPVAAPAAAKATITRQPVEPPAAAAPAVPIMSFNTAILPELTAEERAMIPADGAQILSDIEQEMGPYEVRAYRYWLQAYGVPASPVDWTEAHAQTVAERVRVWDTYKDPIFGRPGWEKALARQDQLAEISALMDTYGMPRVAAFRNLIPELKGRKAVNFTAREADKFLMLLRRVTLNETTNILELDADGEILRVALFKSYQLP